MGRVNGRVGGEPVLEAVRDVGRPGRSGGERRRRAGATNVSRGYTEEMEHFCWASAIQGQYYPNGRAPARDGGLRCNGVIAMADAIMALTANLAMKHKKRIEFKAEWFDPESDAAPETDTTVLA